MRNIGFVRSAVSTHPPSVETLSSRKIGGIRPITIRPARQLNRTVWSVAIGRAALISHAPEANGSSRKLPSIHVVQRGTRWPTRLDAPTSVLTLSP